MVGESLSSSKSCSVFNESPRKAGQTREVGFIAGQSRIERVIRQKLGVSIE